MASRLIAKTEDPKAAVEFLQTQLATIKDPKAREALTDKLKRAVLKWHLAELNKAMETYKTQTGVAASSMQQMIDFGVLIKVPEEPFGGEYIIKEGNIEHTSGEKPLGFKGKSARTGIFKNEFENLNLGDEYKGPSMEDSKTETNTATNDKTVN